MASLVDSLVEPIVHTNVLKFVKKTLPQLIRTLIVCTRVSIHDCLHRKSQQGAQQQS